MYAKYTSKYDVLSEFISSLAASISAVEGLSLGLIIRTTVLGPALAVLFVSRNVLFKECWIVADMTLDTLNLVGPVKINIVKKVGTFQRGYIRRLTAAV